MRVRNFIRCNCYCGTSAGLPILIVEQPASDTEHAEHAEFVGQSVVVEVTRLAESVVESVAESG